MVGTFNLLHCLLVSLICSCYCRHVNHNIQFYEYGEHVAGEQISYVYNGIVPAFKPNYNLNVTIKPEMKQEITYLRVEYYNWLSQVNVNFSQNNSTLSFHIKYPFTDMPIGITGFSLPLRRNLSIDSIKDERTEV